MALAANTSALTDELIVTVANTSDRKDPSRFNSLKRRVEESFKSGQHGRTDQFAVARQLEGLQEKFQVLNKDELADALRSRLNELENHRSSWFPEILSLLIQLSDRPAQLSRVDRLEALKPPEAEKSLSWTELDASESAYNDDEIWQDVDYGAESSDDDVSSLPSETSVPRTFPRSPTGPEEDYVIPEELLFSGEDENLIASIKAVQFWKDENTSVLPQPGELPSLPITELQIIRETIFMLQGLPTSLSWRLDDGVKVDQRYALTHSSNEALSSLLRSFSLIGTKLDTLRGFTKIQQSIPYMQTFHRGIEACLSTFDTSLSNMQSRYISQKLTISISLLQLLEDIRHESKLPLLLADLVSSLKRSDPSRPMQCLDLLYDLVCMMQATGDDNEFRYLAELFFSCFETYARPLRQWMETGRLDSVDETFFIRDTSKNSDLRTLWHDWYTLDEASSLLTTPKFLQPVAHKVFTTGKSMVFLRHLDVLAGNADNLKKIKLRFEDLYPKDTSASLCLPFSVLLESAFEKLITASHSVTSDLLRKELDERCGLWISLQALEHIYLCKDISVLGTIDSKIFDLIDRGRGAWNDRFLLTELAQSTFSILPFIDPSRLIVRSSKAPSRDLELGRSVKILQALSFDYVLPWPVANIITKDAISTYQRISTFLMQIRRAKYAIVKQRLQYSESERDGNHDTLGYVIQHTMLWFVDVIYGHMTELVISTTTESMRKAISSSHDVDAMIADHYAHMTSLENQCLLSNQFLPLHNAIINLLDLCVHFADIQATHHGQDHFDHITRTPNKHRTPSRTPRKKYAHVSDDEDQTDEDEDEDMDEEDAASDPGNTTGISFYEAPYAHRLRNVKNEFDQLVSALAAGLKRVGRVDGKLSWEILADKLEWRR
ncbi:hypothetical protein AWENTII_002837 [Aspergillus wentii]